MMAAYQLNGAQLGWLLIPEQQAASMRAPSFQVCRSICWRSSKGKKHHTEPANPTEHCQFLGPENQA
jgi:hypothetical protein